MGFRTASTSLFYRSLFFSFSLLQGHFSLRLSLRFVSISAGAFFERLIGLVFLVLLDFHQIYLHLTVLMSNQIRTTYKECNVIIVLYGLMHVTGKMIRFLVNVPKKLLAKYGCRSRGKFEKAGQRSLFVKILLTSREMEFAFINEVNQIWSRCLRRS